VSIPHDASVGVQAFKGLTNLTTVTLGDNVQVADAVVTQWVETKDTSGSCYLGANTAGIANQCAGAGRHYRGGSCTFQITNPARVQTPNIYSFSIAGSNSVVINGASWKKGSGGPQNVRMETGEEMKWYGSTGNGSPDRCDGWQVCIKTVDYDGGVFSGNPMLSSVTVGRNVTIGAMAFYNSKTLT